MTTQMATELDIPVVSSGVARSLDHISYLSQLPNVSGVIIGRALFDDEIDLGSAITIGNAKPTVAEFI
jgi:phosphoribosylformimino-5-aminoimidazole carboxamide ribotide isomerase